MITLSLSLSLVAQASRLCARSLAVFPLRRFVASSLLPSLCGSFRSPKAETQRRNDAEVAQKRASLRYDFALNPAFPLRAFMPLWFSSPCPSAPCLRGSVVHPQTRPRAKRDRSAPPSYLQIRKRARKPPYRPALKNVRSDSKMSSREFTRDSTTFSEPFPSPARCGSNASRSTLMKLPLPYGLATWQ